MNNLKCWSLFFISINLTVKSHITIKIALNLKVIVEIASLMTIKMRPTYCKIIKCIKLINGFRLYQ